MPVRFYVDNLAHGGSVISTYEVLQPEYVFNLNDAGTASWNLALSQTRTNGTPMVADEFAPKASDYRLRGDDGVQNTNLQAGRLLDINLESDTGLIRCAGKDWLEYLNQPYYFGAYQSSIFTLAEAVDQMVRVYIAAAGTDTIIAKFGSTQQIIISDILTKANALSDITYTANYSGPNWSAILEYEIRMFDTTTLLGHIQSVGDYGAPLGFDFWCDWDKTIYFKNPRTILNPSSVVTLFNLVYGTDPVIKATWHNAGPLATRTVGKNSRNIWKERSFPGSISAYRDELEIIELGQRYDYGNTYPIIQGRVDSVTDTIGTLHWNPQKDLSLTVLPSRLFPTSEIAGHVSMVGQALSFDSGSAFLPYHRVNATYYIVSQRYYTDDDSGNFLLDLGLQQIYATNAP